MTGCRRGRRQKPDNRFDRLQAVAAWRFARYERTRLLQHLLVARDADTACRRHEALSWRSSEKAHLAAMFGVSYGRLLEMPFTVFEAAAAISSSAHAEAMATMRGCPGFKKKGSQEEALLLARKLDHPVYADARLRVHAVCDAGWSAVLKERSLT